MKIITSIIITLLLFFQVFAQPTKMKALNIGDKVPPVLINNIYNHSLSKVNLADFKDKLIILDFMATGCIGCIEDLPRFDSLQKQYANRLVVLIVSPEPKKTVESFLKNNPIAKKMSLPVVAEDSILSVLFPHVFISHEVWIKDGVVKAITESQYVNSENIATVLNNTPINWPVKRDISEFDYSKPLVHLNEESVPLLSYPTDISYSAFTNNMLDVQHRFTRTIDTASKKVCISLINLSIVDLYRFCYGEISLPASNIVLKVKDTSRFFYSPRNGYRAAWTIKNTYCYETRLPLGLSKEKMQNRMVSDIDFYLGLHSSWETTLIPCLILVKKQSGKIKASFKDLYNSQLSIQHNPRSITSSYIVYMLNENLWGVPVIDESGLDDNKVLDTATLDFSNLSVLNRQIEKYGLQLVITLRKQAMLVITESNK